MCALVCLCRLRSGIEACVCCCPHHNRHLYPGSRYACLVLFLRILKRAALSHPPTRDCEVIMFILVPSVRPYIYVYKSSCDDAIYGSLDRCLEQVTAPVELTGTPWSPPNATMARIALVNCDGPDRPTVDPTDPTDQPLPSLPATACHRPAFASAGCCHNRSPALPPAPEPATFDTWLGIYRCHGHIHSHWLGPCLWVVTIDDYTGLLMTEVSIIIQPEVETTRWR